MTKRIEAQDGNIEINPVTGAVVLFNNGVEVARTLPATTGGFEINNTLTGAGFERIMTDSDVPTGLPDPGGTTDSALRWNGSNWIEESRVRISDAGALTILDSAEIDSVTFSHGGVDFDTVFTNTSDWNITGLTSIQAGTVNVDFNAITATSYGGVLEANLLDKTATETVSGEYTFTAIRPITLSGIEPSLDWTDTDGAADTKNWRIRANSGTYRLDALSDSGFSSVTPLIISRSGLTITEIELNATTLDFNGNADISGTLNVVGTLTATSYGGITEANLLDKTATESISGAYTYTLASTTTPAIELSSSNPWIGFSEADEGADAKNWRWGVDGRNFRLFTSTDAAPGTAAATPINIQRSAGSTVINEIEFNATTLDINGAADISGALTALSYGGIAEANLLDKTDAETISGNYTFQNAGQVFRSGHGSLLPIEFNSSTGMRIEPTLSTGGWTRGVAVHKASDSARIGGFGFLGTDETITHFAVGIGATDWWSTDSLVEMTASAVKVVNGIPLRIQDSTDTDWAEFAHDGTDFNTTFTNTTDWNISGITAIQAGTVDADFDALTSTSYGGILEANLLDKTAAETITGLYTMQRNSLSLRVESSSTSGVDSRIEIRGARNGSTASDTAELRLLNFDSDEGTGTEYALAAVVGRMADASGQTGNLFFRTNAGSGLADSMSIDKVGNVNILGGNLDVSGNITLTGTVDGRDVAADGTKLDGIESGATADQTITLSGDASGSGTTSIAVTVANDSHTHTGSTISGLDTGDTTTGTFADARIAQSNVTQHQAAIDHGSLSGLGDNDHPQYALLTGADFTGRIRVENNAAYMQFNESDAGTDESLWLWGVNNGDMQLLTRTGTSGDGGSGEIAFAVRRGTGTAVSEIELNATTLDFNGNMDVSGTTTFGGSTSGLSASDITTGSLPIAQLITTGAGDAVVISDGRLSDGLDLDTLIESRIHGLRGDGHTNNPPSSVGTFGTLLVLRNSDVGTQVALPRSSGQRLAHRGFSSSGSGWSSWREIPNIGEDVDFGAITATTIGGITEANLLDKSATEQVDGAYTFTAPGSTTPAVTISGISPWIGITETDEGTNAREWRLGVTERNFRLFTATDAAPGSVASTPISVKRTAGSTVINEIELNATTLDFNGTQYLSGNLFIGGDTIGHLRSVTGQYGSIEVTGNEGSSGGWNGYSIEGRFVLMSNGGDNVGIYNDVDNEWMIQCSRNAWTNLYYNGSNKLQTTNTGANISGNLTLDAMTDHVYDVGDLRHLRDVKHFQEKASAVSGNIKITLPELWPDTMISLRVLVYEYDSAAKGLTEFWLSGYPYSPSSTWTNTKVSCNRDDYFTQVRFGDDGSNAVIWIDSGAAHSYPKVIIEQVILSYNNTDNASWADPAQWGLDITTDETGYTNKSTHAASAWTKDSRYALTSHTHDTADITTGTFADARIAQSNVTQHEAALGAEASTVSTIARRNSSGDIQARLFRSEYDSTNASVNFIMTQVDTASNNYIRPSTPAQVVAALGSQSWVFSDEIHAQTSNSPGTPAYSFSSDTDCGMYRSTTNTIGWSTAGVNRMTLNATALTVTGDVSGNSDIILKDDLEVIPDALQKVEQISGYTFTRNDSDDQRRRAGVIAQEIEKILPEVVTENEAGIKSVAYGNLTALLIEAVKELNAKVARLEGKQ